MKPAPHELDINSMTQDELSLLMSLVRTLGEVEFNRQYPTVMSQLYRFHGLGVRDFLPDEELICPRHRKS